MQHIPQPNEIEIENVFQKKKTKYAASIGMLTSEKHSIEI
jgi:hypothetical protein